MKQKLRLSLGLCLLLFCTKIGTAALDYEPIPIEQQVKDAENNYSSSVKRI